MKLWKLLTKHITALPAAVKHKLTPYQSKPHLYGLTQTCHPPLRPVVSSIDSLCYTVADFLHKILIPLGGNTDSFMKNPKHFIKLIQDNSPQIEDYLVRFDVSLFIDISVEEVLQVIRNGLNTNCFSVLLPSPVEDVMELLDTCLTTTNLQFEEEFSQQKEGMAM
jgi:hypothetical protein